MATKPETRFIAKVHKYLHPAVYREKMHNSYRGGTPDVYYEGNVDIMWVEYKYKDKIPKILKVDELLTPLQLRWLTRAYMNEIPVAVVVGFDAGAMWLTEPHQWKTYTRMEVESLLLPVKGVGAMIRMQCLCREST